MVNREEFKALVQGFVQTNYKPVKRDGNSYDQTYKFVHRVLRACLFAYSKLNEANQTARLIRDVMDMVLRRYHGYCIKEQHGAHYRQVGLKHTDKIEFEHVLSASNARDMLIHGVLTIDQAMNIPTCMVSKSNHTKLAKNGLTKKTPDPFYFWKRYAILKIQVETHDGKPVDMNNWDLWDHFSYFKR